MKLGTQLHNGLRPAEARAFYKEERMIIRESRRRGFEGVGSDTAPPHLSPPHLSPLPSPLSPGKGGEWGDSSLGHG